MYYAYIYIYTGFLRSHSLLSKIHAISWVGWCILRVIWGHEDIFIAPLTALNLCKLSAFEKRNTKSASINILELSPYVSRSQLVSHQHFFLQQKWHIYIYIQTPWTNFGPVDWHISQTKKNRQNKKKTASIHGGQPLFCFPSWGLRQPGTRSTKRWFWYLQ